MVKIEKKHDMKIKKKSILKTVGPKYSSSLKEKPTGSLIFIKPENINNKPTRILEILTRYFIYYFFKCIRAKTA